MDVHLHIIRSSESVIHTGSKNICIVSVWLSNDSFSCNLLQKVSKHFNLLHELCVTPSAAAPTADRVSKQAKSTARIQPHVFPLFYIMCRTFFIYLNVSIIPFLFNKIPWNQRRWIQKEDIFTYLKYSNIHITLSHAIHCVDIFMTFDILSPSFPLSLHFFSPVLWVCPPLTVSLS